MYVAEALTPLLFYSYLVFYAGHMPSMENFRKVIALLKQYNLYKIIKKYHSKLIFGTNCSFNVSKTYLHII